MSTIIVQASDRTEPQISSDQTLDQQHDSGTAATSWLAFLRKCIERSRQRTALRLLGQLNDSRLEDIGVSQGEALSEGAKRFWQQ
jgi:uncharacterized protein YjiS (DUF1127 family)